MPPVRLSKRWGPPMGGIYIIAMSTASRWFYRKRATAMGVLGAGGSLGPVVMAPFSAWLIAVYQWRTAYILTGILAWCLMIPAALALKRSPAEIGTGLTEIPVSRSDQPAETGRQPAFPCPVRSKAAVFGICPWCGSGFRFASIW
jgi:MFS family permease